MNAHGGSGGERRFKAAALVARAHLVVWWAEVRQRLGGSARAWTVVAVACAVVIVLGLLSIRLAPEVPVDGLRQRTAGALLPMVLVAGALVWTAFSLAIPDRAAVDTLLTAVPAGAVERRVGLAVVTVLPALTVTMCAALVMAGGLIIGSDGGLGTVGAAATVTASAVVGMACGALAGGALTWALMQSRVVSAPTSRGMAATLVVGLLAALTMRHMGAVGQGLSRGNPLSLVALGAAELDASPLLSLILCVPIIALGLVAVLCGAALGGRPAPRPVAARAPRTFWGRVHARSPQPSLVGLEARQLVRYQPNAGLVVMVLMLAVTVLAVAEQRSALFRSSAYLALCSLTTTAAATVSGIERRADWLYRSAGRLETRLVSRLVAFLAGWLACLGLLGVGLVLRSPFTWSEAVAAWPLLAIELGVVLVVGAFLPVSDEHGVGAVSAELCALVTILLLAVGLPRTGILESTSALVGSAVATSVAAAFIYLWRGRRSEMWARWWTSAP